jgi:hypothetical protein
MQPSTVEAIVVAAVAVPLNVFSVVAMAQMWQRRHDMMVSVNRHDVVVQYRLTACPCTPDFRPSRTAVSSSDSRWYTFVVLAMFAGSMLVNSTS